MKASRHIHRLRLMLLPLFLLSFSLTACQLNQARDPREVVYWTLDVGELGMKAELAIVEAFNKTNPDLHVTLVPVPGSETDITSLLTAARGGTGPDVYYLDRFTVSQNASIGLIQDLSPFLEQEGVTDLSQKFLPFAWNETLYKGNPYALPVSTDARAIFYNKDVLREAGIDPDILDPSHGPITMEQFRDIAFQVNHQNERGQYDRIGFVPWYEQAWHTTWGINYGASFFNPDTCQITPTEPQMIKALTFQYDWAKEMSQERVDTFFATYQPENATANQNPFYTGQLALNLTGNWFVTNLREYAPDVDYGITYIPVENEGDTPTSWSGGFSLVMPTGAQNPEGGYRFMRFMTSEEGQRIYTQTVGGLPTWASLLNNKELFPGNLAFFADLLQYSKSRVPLPVGAQLWDALSTAQESVVLQDATPEEALNTVFQRVQPQLEQYCPL